MLTGAPIGIFGGTFDPIHFGHLRLAQEAVEQCNLASVHFIPSGTPPHRPLPHTAAQHRLNMVRLAIQGNEKFVLDECEIFRTDPCYTVDTLTDLRKTYGAQQSLCLLLGSDAFLLLHTWHEWEKLFSLAHIVVLQRPAYDVATDLVVASPALHRRYLAQVQAAPAALLAAPAGAILVIDNPAFEISSSDVRQRCMAGKNLHYLLPDVVSTYIQSNKLYNYA
jgi:nicotinate-nucleotide adenylyltransferase